MCWVDVEKWNLAAIWAPLLLLSASCPLIEPATAESESESESEGETVGDCGADSLVEQQNYDNALPDFAIRIGAPAIGRAVALFGIAQNGVRAPLAGFFLMVSGKPGAPYRVAMLRSDCSVDACSNDFLVTMTGFGFAELFTPAGYPCLGVDVFADESGEILLDISGSGTATDTGLMIIGL